MGLLLLNGESGLNPRTLFANNEQGLWLDPSQMSTLYQDSNGVTPCTAAGDPVGLILDQSRGGLGAKTQYTLTNGSFDSALTGWNAANATTDTSTSGQVSVTSTSGGAYGFIQATGANVITTAASAWYEIVVDCELISGTGFIGAYTTSGVYTFFTDTGRKTRKIIVQGSNVEARAGVTNSIGTSIIVYDIKVYQVPGNHAYQTTSASRPTLARIPSSGRRNLLTRTEEFDNAAWTKSSATATANTHTSFDGTTTADTLEDASAVNYGQLSQSYTFLAAAYTFSIDIRKTVGALTSYPALEAGPAGVYHIIDTTNGTSAAVGAGQTCEITSLDSNWWRVVIKFTATAGASKVAIYPSASTNGTALSASAVGTVVVSRAQLELGSTASNYQKVVATTDVTESGFNDLWHLVFDGSDDSLVTNSVDFTATDEMTVIAGVRKLSDGADGTMAELSATALSNAGSFLLLSPEASVGSFTAYSRGSAALASNQRSGIAWNNLPAPVSAVVSMASDISAPSTALRANGTAATVATGTQGTGNYGNYQLFIGRRNQATVPFNGHLYQLIIRGKTTSGSKLLEAERFVGKKTGVSF